MEIVIYYLDHKQLVKNAEIFNTCSQMLDYLLVMEQYQQKTEVNLTQNGLPQLQDLSLYIPSPTFTTMYRVSYSLCVLKVPIWHE